MVNRRKTITVKVGSVRIGSAYPVVVQSMTKAPTVDVDSCVGQINQLIQAGCQLVRVAVATRADTAAFAKIVAKVSAPLIADVHFSPDRAIEAIEAGAAKIRLNPGNIKKRTDILRIIDAAKMHKTAVRIGVNEASIRDLRKQDIPIRERTSLMFKEMKKYVRLFENRGFNQIVLSAKSSDAWRTIEVNRRIAEVFNYPLHLGLTHAGLPEDAQVPSGVALGTLLAEGIGDTIRVSTAGDPVTEAEIARRILLALGLCKRFRPELVVCPTCARAQIDVVKLARQVEKALAGIEKPLRVAVMGCIVNGPGEAADADLAVCAAKNKGFIYRKGRKISAVPESKIIPALLKELKNL
ncbi:MAG TPA: flavodoxin-dependent (E)-4-hydroxy-3-methylbut-2-enyl-diphosphate synthase [Sedimentisphaerales bacterium]|nr:flavodoxin-dependent (E)-4-hydroxy-3-methylbut-2-enyl-diphosphate synthase [Sedimentisphaerales bacterium]